MALPAPLQTVTQAFNSVSSFQVTMAASRAQGGLGIGPTVFVAIISYNGTSGNQISSITDSDGDTWTQATDGTNSASASNGSGVNAEGWVCRANGAATTKTITVNLAASLSGTIAITETDQVRSAGTFVDRVRANINTSVSTSRIGSNFASRKDGQRDVCISGLGFNNFTMTCTGVPVSWGNYTGLKDGTSNVGVGVAYNALTGNSEPGVAVGAGIARYNMSVGTTPVALIAITMFRDGYATSTDADAWLDNIEGSITVYASDSEHFIYTSSTSAPFGGTGGSERSRSYSRFDAIDNYIKTGATYGSTFKEYSYVDGASGGDDGTGFEVLYAYGFNTDKFGSAIDSSDDSWGGGEHILAGYSPTTSGLQYITFTTSSSHNPSGYSWSVYNFEGDTQGGVSGTWMYIIEYMGSNPRFRVFDITYPTLATPKQWSLAPHLIRFGNEDSNQLIRL